MRIRFGWPALPRYVRRLSRSGRKGLALGLAVAVAAGLVVAVALPRSSHAGVPAQQTWGGATGRTHRAAAAQTMGRVVNGQVVPGSTHLPGPAVQPSSGLTKGAVPTAAKPRPVRLPARGTSTDKVRLVTAPTPARKAGYNAKTSRQLGLSGADQITYANADGTRTAFSFRSPVNYRRPDGRWATISSTLVPAKAARPTTPATTLLPSASASAAAAASASAAGTPSPVLSPTPAVPGSPSASPRSSASPAPSGSPAPSSSAGPDAGWTERSEAEPESFAPYANAPDLVSLPLTGSATVGFGVAGAAQVAGSAQGDSVTYDNVQPGSDLSFTAGTGMMTERIVLHSARTPASWVFPLQLTGVRAVMGPGGTIEFVTAAGRELAYVPRGFMTDSNIDPHSGDGATSFGVSYSLVTVDGRPAIKMTLDTAWLAAKDRVFPVTVDPSVSSVNSNGTTYVESPGSSDYSTDTEIKVGTWDGGTNVARSFLKFDSVSSSLKNDTVLGARLGVFNTWSYSCSPRAVDVYPVTSSWSVTGSKSYPGPSTGAAVGSKTFATGWVPLGSTVSPCPSAWEGFNLNQAGTNLVNGWTHGTVANNGLALGASGSDSYAWKKFASDNVTNGDPFLAVTYTTDGASYKLASSKPVKLVEPGQNGQLAITVTNTGASTWTTSNGYELSYRAYNSAGKEVANHPVFTPMPSTVAPGQSVTVDATVDQLAAGSYALDFDMYSGATGSSPVAFSSQGIPALGVGLYVPQPPPTVSNVYPPTGYVSPTLTPQLSTVASTKTGTITYSFSVTCAPLPGQTCPANVITSGSLTTPYWTIPSTEMQWNTPYQWTVKATVNGASTTVGPVTVTPEVPQPGITGELGGASSQAFDPQSGNYTTSATDAAVASAGPPLQVARTYNSLDPRTAGAFGAGWSSLADTALRPDSDGSGNVVVTLPSGQEMRFGQNGGGTYAAPSGSPDALVKNSGGTWTLMDASGDQYDFTSGGALAEIVDRNGLTQTFTDNASGQVTTIANPASGRTLTLTWSTPSGASYPHVATVTTSAPASGQPGYGWTYSYSGDELSSVCGPTSGCTAYSYSTGSHYRASVLDAGPRTYWQLGDASGTDATDEVAANLGADDGTYSNVTLGAAGPLAGSTETSAGFNGTNSSVSLPADLITDGTDLTLELWFKAASSTSSGVLFSDDADALTSSTGNTDHHDPALYVGGNGELYGEFWNGSIDPLHSTANVDDGKWHQAVLSGDGTTQSLYLDGALVGTLSGQINQQNQTVDTIGAGFWQGGWPNSYATIGPSISDPAIGYFSGDIAQAAVYPHALGLPAIASHDSLAATASPEMTQVTLPSGHTDEQASYDPGTGRLTGYTDPHGGQWAISNPIASGYKATSDSLGEVLEYVTVTDPAGRDEVYGYDELDGGRLVSYGNGADPAESYGYDGAGFLASVTDADGNLVCFTNDIHGNVLTRTWYPIEPASLPGGGTGTVSNCGGSTASSATCTTSGAPCTTFYSYYYNASNPLDPRNDELTGLRDGRSTSATSTTYLTTYAYNTSGQLTSQTTPDTSDFPVGRATAYTYSTGTQTAYGGSGTVPAGLLLTETTPGSAQTSYQYYSDGDLAQVTEPSGQYTVYTYDGLGRPQTSKAYTTSYPSGQTTSYSYTATGQPAQIAYPGVTNQVASVTHTLQDAYSYDSDGNLLSQTLSDLTGGDPSRTTSYTYNDHDEVATVTQPAGATTGGGSQSQGASSANPQGATTGYDYDTFGNTTSVTDPDGNVYRYAYNEYNEVDQEELYTASKNEASSAATCTAPATQDPDGGCDLVEDSYSYDPAGLLASATDAMGRITNYTYDTDQDPIASTTTDASTNPTTGRQTLYGYDGAGNVVSQSVGALSGGAAGTTTTTDYTIDAADRLTSELIDPTPSGTSASGYANRSVSYTYNADNDVTSQTTGTAAEGGTSVTSYGYDTAGDLTSRTVADGSSSPETTWTYNQDGQPLSMVSPEGNVSGATAANYTTNYTYDQVGDPATVTGPPVATQTYAAQTPVTTRPVTTYGYDTYGDQTQAKDPDGNTTVSGYDGDGRVTSVAQPSYTPPGSSAIAATAHYAYDEDGNLAQVTDPQGNVTQYSHDALGDLTSVTQPLLPGQSAPGVWSYTYDAEGEQLSATDPLLNTTQETWNYFGEQATSTDALHNTTRDAYDYLGDLTKQTTPDSVVTNSTYDHLGELLSTADSSGDTTGYTYNDQGEVAQVTNPDGSYAQNAYDEAGQLTSVTDYGYAPAGQAAPQLRSESFGYDPDGNPATVDDWDNYTTTDTYNAAGELTRQVQPVSSSASDTTSYGYDPAGNQTALTDGNSNTTWTTYNPWNLPESVIEPATPAAASAANRTWTTGYNADGQAAKVTQPGGIALSYAYNPLGEMTSQSGSGAQASTPTATFGYDLDGRMNSATAPGGTDAFGYNANSQLNSASGPSGTSSYNYNNDELVSSETDSAGATSYTYDNADRLATESEPLTGATLTYGYNSDSQPTSLKYSVSGATGPKQTFGYDTLDRLSSDTLTSASAATISSESYGYNNDSDLTSQTTTGLAGAGTTTYGYDQADDLTSSVTSGATTSYAYDSAGNLTQSGGTSYSYNAQDQVTSSTNSAGNASYGYTLSGALSSATVGGSTKNYTSNAYGQQATAGSTSYAYDALGRLVNSGGATLSYAGTSDTLASDGTYKYSYTPAGELTAAQTSGGSAYTTMSDLHDDLTGTFSPTSTATSTAGSASYSPFGTATTTGYRPSLGYQGDYTDSSTGAVNMNARWYSPSTGSFTSNDTVSGSPVPSTVDGNRYAYADGNPLTMTDFSGQCAAFLADVCDAGRAIEHGAEDVEEWAGSEGDALVDYGGEALEGLGIGAGFSAEASIFGLSALFTAGDWIFGATRTASGCGVDIICSSGSRSSWPGSVSFPYYSATQPGGGYGYRGSYGSQGGYGYYGGYGYSPYSYVPVPPPPPPPPPQDCYAGPNPSCTPPAAPGSLRDDQWITRIVHDVTSVSQLFRSGHGITEVLPPVTTKPAGTTASPTTNGNPANSVSDDTSTVTQDIHDIGPSVPTVTTPNGGTGGSGVGSGAGGGGPPPPNTSTQASTSTTSPTTGGTNTESSVPVTATTGGAGQGGGGSLPTASDSCAPEGPTGDGNSGPEDGSGSNIVYRALNSQDVETMARGEGIVAKNPAGSWSLGTHLVKGSSSRSWANDPWISTSRDQSVSEGFNECGNNLGVVAIDLDQVASETAEGWRIYPRLPGEAGLPYYYSIWQQEVSIYQSIPQEAILGFVR